MNTGDKVCPVLAKRLRRNVGDKLICHLNLQSFMIKVLIWNTIRIYMYIRVCFAVVKNIFYRVLSLSMEEQGVGNRTQVMFMLPMAMSSEMCLPDFNIQTNHQKI